MAEADEVTLCIRGCKTDQLNRGEWRNHSRAKNGAGLCVVEALELYERWAPERFRGAERLDRLFVWPSGRLLARSEVQQVLCSAAVAEGIDPKTLSTATSGRRGTPPRASVTP